MHTLVQAQRRARVHTAIQRQDRWTSDKRGRCTGRLIKQSAEWTDRKHGEINNYFLTQFLTGHGLFRSYLYSMGKVDRPELIFWRQELDNVHHKFLNCDRWMEPNLENNVIHITPNIIIGLSNSNSHWGHVAKLGFKSGKTFFFNEILCTL